MARKLATLAVVLAACAVGGCGGTNQVADKPSDEEIKAVEQADKMVQDEEQGTPIKGKKGR